MHGSRFSDFSWVPQSRYPHFRQFSDHAWQWSVYFAQTMDESKRNFFGYAPCQLENHRNVAA